MLGWTGDLLGLVGALAGGLLRRMCNLLGLVGALVGGLLGCSCGRGLSPFIQFISEPKSVLAEMAVFRR